MLRPSRIIAAAWLASAVAAIEKYAYFCQRRIGDGKLSNSCSTDGKCNGTGVFVASATFTPDDGVCEGFVRSGPVCDEVTHHCYEAVDFQLIWDRNKDFVNDYMHEDWYGISMMFHNSSAIFVPGRGSFAHKTDVELALADFHSKQPGLMKPTIWQVLTSGEEHDEGRIIHATGSWQFNGTNATELPFYSRWVSNTKDHWVVESLVIQLGTKSAVVAPEQNSSLFAEISQRAAQFTDLYNAGELRELASMYSDSAVIIPLESRPIEKTNVASYFGSKPLGAKASLQSKIASQAPGNDAVHEVGYSESTQAGYLARWVKNRKSEWVIETQLFAVFPKDSLTDAQIIV